MAAEKDSSSNPFAQGFDRVVETGAIALCFAWKRRSGTAFLTVRQIAAQN
jgi:hypothetical protein